MKKMLLFFILIAMLVLQACSTKNIQNEHVEKEIENADSELIILKASDATNLDPHFVTDMPSTNVVHGKVYETLVAFDKDRKIVPLLAKSWEQTDELTWTFILNEGIHFHDGTDFNAKAVKTTLDRLLDPALGSPQWEKVSMIKEVLAEDDYTVVIKLKEPYAPLLAILASHEGSMISAKAVTKGSDQLATHPVGTGPFIFDSWEKGKEIKLKTNAAYWGNLPKYGGVTFKIVPDDMTRLKMVEKGEAHIAEQVAVANIDYINNSPTLNLFRAESLAVEFIGFNVEDALLKDVQVRRAISHAINREAIIHEVYHDTGTLANSSISPKVIGYSTETKAYDYDVEEAKTLLRAAGIKEGTHIKFLVNDRTERIQIAKAIQAQLKEIGLEMDIQIIDSGDFVSEVLKGQHQLFIRAWGNATGDADYNQYNLFHSSAIGVAGNHFNYSNPEVDALIEKGRAISYQVTRNSIYKEVMQKELDDAVYVPLRNDEHLAAYHNMVQAFWLDSANFTMIRNIQIAK
ncbi:glutathione ABC transporter substrate-binding protein [Lysinibacillus piscis]|uniref:Glutathione ABC transporter substrate-binding protein n=1 Tax=Lysinibacillus piscis TaxID=2518931 RepID=A0ABQ5NJC8_9BACI|nr:glutathione ABC transporter substrate-binding protein [Lysinibacillus sp. KH24]GLC88177.1 glutathione ABC transporter substrate-binding protein [Lysinibacillus sp. KH24]